MMPMLILEQRRAIAPEVRKEQVETSLALNLRKVPRNVTAVFNVLEILVGVTFLHLPLVHYQPRAEVEVTPFVQRWRMQKTKYALGRRRGYLDVHLQITLPHTPLFCVVSVRLFKVEAFREAFLVITPLMRHLPQSRPAP